MKSLEELEAIRKKMIDTVSLRSERDAMRVVVGMGTCGIAAGARTVLVTFMDEIAKRGLSHVTVAQKGCAGSCELEPVVEVIKPCGEKVTYVKVSPDMVGRIVEEHVANGNPVAEYTAEYYEAHKN